MQIGEPGGQKTGYSTHLLDFHNEKARHGIIKQKFYEELIYFHPQIQRGTEAQM